MQGKTSLLEAVGWVATARSFRGVPDAALVRAGEAQAILRAEIVDDGRRQSLEAELRAVGRNRVLLNRHPLTRTPRPARCCCASRCSRPTTSQLVKGGPARAA